jgi:hypothetical protein
MKAMSIHEPLGSASSCLSRSENCGHGASEGPSPFLMCAFFLLLASIPVVVVGGHFPWFILPPLLVLLMFAHVRRVEAKFQRDHESVR